MLHFFQKIEVREMERKSEQKSTEDLDDFTATKDNEMAVLMKKRQLVLAETNKQLAQIKEEEDADTMEIKANAELVVAKLNKQRDIQQSKIRSTGIAEAAKIKIETETYIQSMNANAEAEIAKNTAKSLEMEADAEEYAAKSLKSKRAFDKSMRSLQMMRGLAWNNDVVITGNSKDNVMAQLVANQKGGVVLGINQ